MPLGPVLVGCERSGAVTAALREVGVEAYSCDIQQTVGDNPQWHIHGDVFDAIASRQWSMGIFFPTCTYLTVSANKWYKDQPKRASGTLVGAERRAAREEAIKFFMRLYNCNIPRVAIENPIGVMSSRFRKPDQVLQPWMFGHTERKATCLWLKGLPKLTETNNVREEMLLLPKKEQHRLHYLPKTADRWQIRSRTFDGIAKAMANQWNSPC